MFNWILKEARESMQFLDEEIFKEGRVPAPLHLKIVACFRYLATGCPMKGNEEASGLAKSAMVVFAPYFFEWFNAHFFVEWVSFKQPSDEARVRRLMKPFDMCGMTGAVCSRNGVHFATHRAKSQQRY